MTSSINVFSDASKHALGGDWYPNTENYPACKFLITDENVETGDSEWTDRIGGIVVNANTTFTKDSNGVSGALAATTSSLTGTLPVVGDLHPLWIWTGIIGVAGDILGIGDAAAGIGMDLAAGPSGYITLDAVNHYLQSNVLSSASPSYPFAGAMGLWGDKASNEARKHGASSTTYAGDSVKLGTTGTIDSTWAAFTNQMAFPSNAAARVKMAALFCFTNVPNDADIESAVSFMAANPGKFPPNFAGKT